MRAILIDPETRTITEVDYDGNYKSINKLISVELFTVVNIDHYEDETTECIFVDDEGLLNDPRYFFMYDDYIQPMAGKGLILGCNAEGDSIATQLSLEYVKEVVRFVELSVEGFAHEEGEEEIMGQKFFTIKETPIFGPPKKEE